MTNLSINTHLPNIMKYAGQRDRAGIDFDTPLLPWDAQSDFGVAWIIGLNMPHVGNGKGGWNSMEETHYKGFMPQFFETQREAARHEWMLRYPEQVIAGIDNTMKGAEWAACYETHCALVKRFNTPALIEEREAYYRMRRPSQFNTDINGLDEGFYIWHGKYAQNYGEYYPDGLKMRWDADVERATAEMTAYVYSQVAGLMRHDINTEDK